MSDSGRMQQSLKQIELIEPKETLLLRYVSTITGHTYDETMVDHLADMLLIFYAAGGTVLGAILACALSVISFADRARSAQHLSVVLTFVFLGAVSGCAAVMALLNLRGLVRWDNFVLKRTATVKAASMAKVD